MAPQLLSLSRRSSSGETAAEFPFHIPAVRTLATLSLDRDVTVLVGENGSGKSTVLESLAIAAALPAVGSDPPERDPSLAAQRRLARDFKLVWRARSHRGFFLRAEDFFGFQKGLRRSRQEHVEEIQRLQVELEGHSELARTLALMPHRNSIQAMDGLYGREPDAASHGEAFLKLFRSRLVPGGLYLLDEPEAALSPQSQLAFLAMVRDAVAQGSQFVIATHSPILMAIPGAGILSFDQVPVSPVSFEELEAVRLMKDFLQAPHRYLRHLWGD